MPNIERLAAFHGWVLPSQSDPIYIGNRAIYSDFSCICLSTKLIFSSYFITDKNKITRPNSKSLIFFSYVGSTNKRCEDRHQINYSFCLYIAKSKLQEFTEKEERFNLEIENESHNNPIHYSYLMLLIQPSDSGKPNMTKSCTEYSKNI